MTDKVFYRYKNINISVKTNSKGARYYFDEYILFEKVEDCSICDISLEFYDNHDGVGKYIAAIPDDAALYKEVEDELHGRRIFKRYKKNDYEMWNVACDIGIVYINLKEKHIEAYYGRDIDNCDILPFILFCNNPLISVIKRFDLRFMHAACLNINGKYALITGLSGRGKSTATFSLIKKGHIALTDEATLLECKNGQYFANAMMGWIKVGEDAKERFFSDSSVDFIRCGSDYIYKLKDLGKTIDINREKKIDYIFILEQTGKSDTKIKLTNGLEVVREILPVALSFESKEYISSTFNIFIDMMEKVALRKICFGTDMDQFVDAVEAEIG